MNNSPPTVSIGVPVFNGATTLKAALDSVLNQTYSDFEIIISDNCSTDGTAAICENYAAQDGRIRYVRQEINIGAEPNFKFVLDEAQGKYFMWAAADDIRSLDFVEVNFNFLEENPAYVASTSPNCFEGQDYMGPDVVSFAIKGSIEDRFDAYLDNCWKSNGIFYALIRRYVIQNCDQIGKHYLANDWAINLYLASRGEIHRTDRGMIILGDGGLSNSRSIWSAFRTSLFSWIFPFYRFSYCAIKWSSNFPVYRRMKLIYRLLKLNMLAAYNQIYAEIYSFYFRHIRLYVRKNHGK